MRYELRNGTIYALSLSKPPHSGVVRYLTNRFRPLDSTFSLRVQDVLEIDYREDTPQPDIAIVNYRDAPKAIVHGQDSVFSAGISIVVDDIFRGSPSAA